MLTYQGLAWTQHLLFTQKYHESRAPPKNIFATPKYIPILYIYLQKTLKCIEMTHKTSPILVQLYDDPQKVTTKFLYHPPPPKKKEKYSFFCKPPKIIEFKIFNPNKWSKPTHVLKYQIPPNPHPHPLGRCLDETIP